MHSKSSPHSSSQNAVEAELNMKLFTILYWVLLWPLATFLHKFQDNNHGGECDLVLISAPDFHNGLGLLIHVRTTIHWGYSIISSAAINIGSDILEVDGWGDYYWNGVIRADLPFHSGLDDEVAINVTRGAKTSVFDIIIAGSTDHIQVKTFKDFVSVVLLHGTTGSFATSVGMIGPFDIGHSSGSMLARDGQTILHDPIAFCQEWQVRDTEAMLFQTTRSPPYPEKCILPNLFETKSPRVGIDTIDHAMAEQACARWGEDGMMRCVKDVIATGDLDLAQEGMY